jgi:alpha-galactosidase
VHYDGLQCCAMDRRATRMGGRKCASVKNRNGGITVTAALYAALAIGTAGLGVPPAFAQTSDVSIHSDFLALTVRGGDGSYEVRMPADEKAVLQATTAVMLENVWVRLKDYPRHRLSKERFESALGTGHQVTVTSTGLPNRPDLTYTLRLYHDLPFGELEVELHNRTLSATTVQTIRMIEATAERPIDLKASDSADRVLSDSFSEDWQAALPIYDLGKAPQGMHRAVGSQVVYNRSSGRSLFVGALTSERFLTIMHLQARADDAGMRIASYTVDSTGTTEVQAPYWHPSAKDRVELSFPLRSGGILRSERLLFSVGTDYHAQLEAYGAAVRRWHHARVGSANLMGWWSWLPYYFTINEGAVLTTAQWLAEHLKGSGYEFLQIDEGYAYARGEYATPNASHFPGGMRKTTREVTRLGLKLGIWTAPFYVGSRSWVYEHHQDWLVNNLHGAPLSLGRDNDVGEDMFVLDPTHPGAQEYLKQTYRKLVREWGMRYIKLDFMDQTTVEGRYHRPNTTALEAQRIGLELIRSAVGEDVLLDKDASPMLNTVGLVDEGRISGDTEHSYKITKERAPGIAARYYMHRNFFVNDPDAFSVQEAVRPSAVVTGTTQAPLALNEAEVAIVLAAVSGGMFEIGDDLPTLGSEPDRLALVTNPDVLQMAKLGRAALPVDLLTYGAEDEQPSVFLLREDQRQSMLAVFNWSEQPRHRTVAVAELGLSSGDDLGVSDVLSTDRPLALDRGTIRFGLQPARSVRLIKIVDQSVRPAPPTVTMRAPANAEVGEAIGFAADVAADGVPAVDFHWDFGDGVTADGQEREHTYTLPGAYTVRLVTDGVDGVPSSTVSSITVAGAARQESPRRYVDPTE